MIYEPDVEIDQSDRALPPGEGGVRAGHARQHDPGPQIVVLGLVPADGRDLFDRGVTHDPHGHLLESGGWWWRRWRRRWSSGEHLLGLFFEARRVRGAIVCLPKSVGVQKVACYL